MYEKALLGQTEASAIAAQVLKRWSDQRILFRYTAKRELLGNLIEKVIAAKTANANLTVVTLKLSRQTMLLQKHLLRKLKKELLS